MPLFAGASHMRSACLQHSCHTEKDALNVFFFYVLGNFFATQPRKSDLLEKG